MKVKELRDYLNKVAEIRPDGLEEEITLGEFDIKKIIEADRMKHAADSKQKKEYAEGQPVYMSGKELIKYRK